MHHMCQNIRLLVLVTLTECLLDAAITRIDSDSSILRIMALLSAIEPERGEDEEFLLHRHSLICRFDFMHRKNMPYFNVMHIVFLVSFVAFLHILGGLISTLLASASLS